MRRESRALLRNGAYSWLQTLLKLAFPVVTFAYASRALGEAGIGRVQFAKSVASLFAMLAMLGIDQYAGREAAKRRDDPAAFGRFAREMLLLNGLTALAAYLLFALAMWTIPALREYRALLGVCSLAILLRPMGMEWLYRAAEEFRWPALATTAALAISLAAMFLFVRNEGDALAYCAVNLLSTHGACLLLFARARGWIGRRSVRREGARAARPSLRRHLRPILGLFAISASVELYTALDGAILGLLRGDVAVGRYAAASRVTGMVNALLSAAGCAMVARMAYFGGRGDRERMQALAEQIYNTALLLAVPAALGLIALSGGIVRLAAGPEFASAASTLRLLAPVALLIPFSVATNQQILVPIGAERRVLISTLIGAAVNFALDVLLVPRFAENGAAVATVIAEFCVAAVCFANVRRRFDMRRVMRGHWQYWLAATPVFPLSRLLRGMIGSELLYAPCAALLCAACYFALLILLRNPYLMQIFGALRREVGRARRRGGTGS